MNRTSSTLPAKIEKPETFPALLREKRSEPNPPEARKSSRYTGCSDNSLYGRRCKTSFPSRCAIVIRRRPTHRLCTCPHTRRSGRGLRRLNLLEMQRVSGIASERELSTSCRALEPRFGLRCGEAVGSDRCPRRHSATRGVESPASDTVRLMTWSVCGSRYMPRKSSQRCRIENDGRRFGARRRGGRFRQHEIRYLVAQRRGVRARVVAPHRDGDTLIRIAREERSIARRRTARG